MYQPKMKLLLQLQHSPSNTKSNVRGRELLDASAILVSSTQTLTWSSSLIEKHNDLRTEPLT
jgi:hypothetical protein